MEKNGKQANNGRRSLPVILIAVAVLLMAAVLLTQNAGRGPQTGGSEEVRVIAEGESLVIPAGEVTGDASFYPVEVDGTQMEVLAVRDSAGVIRTAYNTCQICYDSGRGYYVQSGSVLVCQNCGNRFTADQVEVQSGGCNPWPIFPQSKTVTDEAVCISYDELHRATEIFAGWKQ